jgi:hydrophobic/amphiphilic exporter-1 (mainly G- bacteria), HAE1 family
MSKFFIRRPIVAMVISIVMVIVGMVSMSSLPIAQYPDIVPPEILLSATYPGADATTLTQSVATPIEQQMSGVDHMNYMYSTNSNTGSTSLTVDFKVGTDPNVDQILTQLRYSQASSQLPSAVTNAGVTVQKALSSPLMLFSISSPNGTYDSNYLANYAYINLVDQLARVEGIGRVQVLGTGQYAMRIWVKPDQLAKLGVTISQITAAIATQNTVNPAGQIGGEPIQKDQQFTYTVISDGRLVTEQEFGDIVVRASPNGSVVHLKDVARIELGAQSYSTTSRANGQPAALLALYQLPGSNAVQAVKNARAEMATLEKTFPHDMTYTVALDTTKAVSAGIHEIVLTLFIALALVILVVYIFLQGWRATLIPLLAVPVSLIGTFAVFPLLGFSINTLSLFGLVLAIGLVVDDAIVVVEAVEHHIQEGLNPKDATIKAMEEVSSPVIAIALILSAVFIPTAFVSGITGRLYQQFAITIAVSVLISAFNALTLSPALCALLLKPAEPSKGLLSRFFDWFNRIFKHGTNTYVSTSAMFIRKWVIALLLLVVVGAIGIGTGMHLPSSFLPEEDQGYMMVSLQLPEASSLSRTLEASKQVENILRHTPGVSNVNSAVGFNLITQTQTTYNAFFFVTLKDWDQRKSKEEQYVQIKQRLAQGLFGGVRNGLAFSFPPPAIPGVGTSGATTFVLEDRSGGQDNNFLANNVDKFIAAASKRPEIAAAMSTALPHVPQLRVHVDRAKAMQQGVNLSDVYQTLQTFMGGSLVNYFNRFGRQWQTYVEADADSRTSINNIGEFYVQTSNGGRVPLSSVATVTPIYGPEFTMRFNEHNAAQIMVTGAPGYSSGQVMAALEQVFGETMPPGMGYDYMGMAFQEKEASKGTSSLLTYSFSLIFVFLILAALYESWTLPFSVLMGTPIAIFGGYLALWMRDFDNNTYAQIGLVMLIGLAAKNAILIVEFAKLNYDAGTPLVEAALGAARVRLRPILMTAFAFILGCVPLWTASGAGAQARRILGTVCIGGMLAATVLEIFIIPVLFVLIERISHHVKTASALPDKQAAEPKIPGDAE